MLIRSPAALATVACAALALLAGCGSSAGAMPGAQASAPAAASAEHPIVVELYQSQGCSSCPPADAYLNGIADRPEVLALSFAVTYWDRLGWKDTFGSPKFTERQQDYANAGRGQVATPEIIVNGSQVVLGANRPAFDATIANAGAARGGPDIALDGGAVRLGRAPATMGSTVWLVRYDPRLRSVPVRAGENGGRTLPHRNIVRELVKLGNWSGSAASYPLPKISQAGLATAVLVQNGPGGAIIAARKI